MINSDNSCSSYSTRSTNDCPKQRSSTPNCDFPHNQSRTSACRNTIAVVNLNHFDVPLVLASGSAVSPHRPICLLPDRPYTIGRRVEDCEFIFHDRRVSKHHCQILYDCLYRKIYIIDGFFKAKGSVGSCVATEFRNRLLSSNGDGSELFLGDFGYEVSCNGVFVNGVRVRKGMAVELLAGDMVLLVCGNEDAGCSFRNRVGFVVQRVQFVERGYQGCDDAFSESTLATLEVSSSGHSQGHTSSGKRSKRVFASRAVELLPNIVDHFRPKHEDLIRRAKFLSSLCRDILLHDDPLSYIRLTSFDSLYGGTYDPKSHSLVNANRLLENGPAKSGTPSRGQEISQIGNPHTGWHNKRCRILKANIHNVFIKQRRTTNDPKFSPKNSANKENLHHLSGNLLQEYGNIYLLPPGKNFYLNRLHFISHDSQDHHATVSLPELLYPVQSISKMFIATFTCDIYWFLSYCEIPFHLPVTLSCHNTDRCWSSNPDKRISYPCPDYPNLVMVNPMFPESIAFGNNREKQGIACHHPKLIVLQREESIRVVITSANLVPRQWNNVTNTVWWQDFPRSCAPDYLSLFTQSNQHKQGLQGLTSDFASQLAGFMASLLIDVPRQAHWIVELTKYDFKGAMGYLIASVPGIHTYRTCLTSECMQTLPLLGSIMASVVGLSHLFKTAADSKGMQLRKLAAFLQNSCKHGYGMSEIVLRRNPNVPADSNAVSILVPNPDGFSVGVDCVQLGFLPRNVAKWVSPLWDIGFFNFSGYVFPKEALSAAFGENNKRVQLILHVSKGPHFETISEMIKPEHVVALSSLISSIQRCSGLWRLHEVLSRYNWPESLESDLIYGSSSIGSSVSPQFRAAFSAAAGKKAQQFFDSEESDPEWGQWTANEELKSPSVKILFPTIERVKNAFNGVLSSRYILCLSERTWQGLRTIDIMHDAIPHPRDRIGHPMHVKVARRRFQSQIDGSSCGWVYCGSHNFSAAAWGRQISNPCTVKADGPGKPSSSDTALHICNYELGIIFIFPPKDKEGSPGVSQQHLDDVSLPFVVPAPKYGPGDRPATMQAMREALAEISEREREKLVEAVTVEEIMEEIHDEEEAGAETTNYVTEEKEEEKAYAEMLWSQVDSQQSG